MDPINIDPNHVAKVVAYATAVGGLWPVVQSILQKPWLAPKWKTGLTIGASVVFGLAGYLVNGGFDFSDPSKIVLWVVGLYAAINVMYRSLKSAVYIPLESSTPGVIGPNLTTDIGPGLDEPVVDEEHDPDDEDDDHYEPVTEGVENPYPAEGPQPEGDDVVISK